MTHAARHYEVIHHGLPINILLAICLVILLSSAQDSNAFITRMFAVNRIWMTGRDLGQRLCDFSQSEYVMGTCLLAGE